MRAIRPRASLVAHVVTAIFAAACWLSFATHSGPVREGDRTLSFVVDFEHYYRPNAEYLGARLSAGELPLWNPQQGLGGPFLATIQPGVLYPPNLLHAILPAHTALVWLCAFHVALAALLAAALARRLGAGVLGGSSAALLYVGSVTLLESAWTPPLLATSALAPGVLLALDRLISRPSASRAVVLGIVSALQIVAGWPLMVVMTAYTAALYAGVRLVVSARARWRRAFSLLFGLAMGGALAAPLLIPAYELLARSARALGSIDRGQAVFVDAPHDPFVVLDQLVSLGATGGLPGVLALALAVLALWRSGPRFARLASLAFAALVFFLASFPNDLPFYDALRTLPLLGDFRFPFHYREMTALLVAVLAGVGLSRIGGRVGPVRAVAALLAVGVPLWSIGETRVSMPRSTEARRTLAEQLQQISQEPEAKNPERIFWSNGQGKSGRPTNFHMLSDLEPLTLMRTAEFATFIEAGRAIGVEDAAYRPPGRPEPMAPLRPKFVPYYGRSRVPSEPSRALLLDALSIDWILAESPPPWLAQRYVPMGRRKAISIYRNRHAMPRAYRVNSVEEEPVVLEAALTRLLAPDFDIRSRALVRPLPEGLPSGSTAGAPPPVEVIEYSAERVRLRTSDTVPGVLVLTDAWYPGWHVLINGEAAPMLRVNAALRGVRVGPGVAEVEFAYQPQSLRVGASLALAAIGLGGVAIVFERRRQRRVTDSSSGGAGR